MIPKVNPKLQPFAIILRIVLQVFINCLLNLQAKCRVDIVLMSYRGRFHFQDGLRN